MLSEKYIFKIACMISNFMATNYTVLRFTIFLPEHTKESQENRERSKTPAAPTDTLPAIPILTGAQCDRDADDRSITEALSGLCGADQRSGDDRVRGLKRGWKKGKIWGKNEQGGGMDPLPKSFS